MRILTIVNNLDVGGAQGSAYNASLAYIEQGQDVAALAYRGGGVREQKFRDASIDVFIGGRTAQELDAALAEASAWQPDVLHIHRAGHEDPGIAHILSTIKERTKARVAVIETNIFGRVDDSKNASHIDVHMMLTRTCLWKWRQWARGLSPQPIGTVAPNIVRSDGFYPAGEEARRAFREEYSIPQDAIVFGRVGQPIRTKWSHAAFKAFSAFAQERTNAWFLAVGLPRNYPKYLKTFPDDVRRRIVVIDFLHGEEALRAAYAGMDVFLHSARIGESFGIVLAESMLCERPIVTLSTPLRDNSQLEVVGHERGGLVAASVRAMVKAMAKLADDPALRQKLGKQGRQWCLEHYDSAVVGATMTRVATLAHQHADRAKLKAAIERDPMLETNVTDDDIEQLLSRSVGRHNVLERFAMWLTHQPMFYRFWSVVRRVQRKIRGPGAKQRRRQATGIGA